jgi:tetratricopeptide (TPR) repeat protein
MADPAETLRRAVAALDGGRADEARELCRGLLAAQGERPASLRVLARAERVRGDPDAALTALERALALTPEDVDLRLEQAACLAGAGRTDEAAAALGRALDAQPGDARLHNRAGEMLGRMGRADAARRAFERALTLAPELAAARYNLGLLCSAAGDAAAAVGLFRRVCRERPQRPEPWLQLGGALNLQGQYDAAADALDRHLALAPSSVPGWTWLGAARQFQGRFDDAEGCYRRAIALDPGAADAHANLGRLLQAQGRPQDAAVALRRALAQAPRHPQARAGLAALLDNEGRYAEALELAADEDGCYPPATAAIAARVERHRGRPEAARRILERALAAPGLPAEAEVQLRYSLGQALDEAREYEAAARVFRDANRRARSRFGAAAVKADLEALARAAADLEQSFAAAALAALPRSGNGSERPLFVIGLPRSGKSLVEQILCSHPAVHGAGELTAVSDLAAELGAELGGWPAGVAGIAPGRLATAAERYLEILAAADPAAARVTDTMPFNFMHLGLIELLFPRARVIHCVRAPADLALRCYAKNFAGRSLAFTTDLEDIASYVEGYRRIMAHWEAVSALALHTLAYEDLVRDPDETVRGLLDFAGLEWDERCLRFFEPGVATSASDVPVRRALHDREVGAWRHYEGLLAGVVARLGQA